MVVGRVVAVVARVVVCLNGVGVRVTTCVKPARVRRRIAYGSSSTLVISSLGSMARSLGGLVVVRDVVLRSIVVMLTVGGVLVLGELTCGDVGRSCGGARGDPADGCEEWTRQWSGAGG